MESPIIFEYPDLAPSGVDAVVYGTGSAAAADPAPEAEWIQLREEWLRDEVRRAGVRPDTIDLRVAIGRPADEILAERARGGGDLIVMGSQ